MKDLKTRLDQHIIKIIEHHVNNGSIKSKAEFYEKIHLKKQNYYRIKMGYAHFTFEHVYRIRKFLNLEPEQIFNL